MILQLSLLGFLVFWLFAVGLIFFWRFKRKKALKLALNMALFLVRVPKDSHEAAPGESQKDWKQTIGVAEQFFSSLHGLLLRTPMGAFTRALVGLEIAVPEAGKDIYFYLACPLVMAEGIEKQIHSFYPAADVERIEGDYNIFNKDGGVAVAKVTRRGLPILPIKTYQDFAADALEGLATAVSKVDETGEGAAIQIIIEAASGVWQGKVKRLAQELKKGVGLRKALKASGAGVLAEVGKIGQEFGGEIFKAATAAIEQKPIEAEKEKQKEKEKPPESKLSPVEEELLKRIEARAHKPGFMVNIRLVTSSQSDSHARELLTHLEGAFGQFALPQLGSLGVRRLQKRALRNAIHDFSYRMFRPRDAFLLDAEELATIFHFPTPYLQNVPVAYLKARLAPPPTNLPKEGIMLGKSVYRGQEVEVRLTRDDRRRHLYTVGQTGVGKSALLENMILQDIAAGEGCCFIDPHGDTAERILSAIPKERAEDVIYFNPTDLERPMGLNMLEYDPAYAEQKTFIANEVINIFKKIWADVPEAFGPMFEQYMRNALLLVMEDPASGNTLMEVPRVLADKEFRKLKLSRCGNPVVKDFWELEAEKAGGEAKLENMVPYITSKTNVFIANDYMRPIIAQEHSAFNFREVMDAGKILIVNLAKGKLGDMNAQLLGLVIVGRLLFAALSRTDIEQEKRRDFYLYIDEFQNFATESIATILSEARKYRLDLVMAHQFIAQLIDKIRDAVFGNVGSFAIFRVGAQDAEFLEKYVAPVFTKQDLINIDNHNAYVKLLINNFTSEPFNMVTMAPQAGNPEMAARIKEYSRLKYGQDREEIERGLRERKL